MNAWRIALAVFLLQSSIILAGFANIPVSCDPADQSQCLYFSETLVASTSVAAIINGEVDDSQYKTARIETDIFNTDVYTATTIAVDKGVSIMAFAGVGVFSLVRFFFGWTTLTFWMGVLMQAVVHYFYLRTLVSIIKEGKGEV